MSIIHYFSSDENKRAKFIFNLIAPLYSKFNDSITEGYSQSVIELDQEIGLANKSILDIGSGTGAWIGALSKFENTSCSGTDFSEKMIIQAKKNFTDISFSLGDAENLSSFEDNTFDIVTAAYVLHGVKAPVRAKILSEMKRISKKYVIIHDFFGRTHKAIQVLEFLERSDYKNFKKNFTSEMIDIFGDVYILSPSKGSGLYISKKSNDSSLLQDKIIKL